VEKKTTCTIRRGSLCGETPRKDPLRAGKVRREPIPGIREEKTDIGGGLP